MDDALHAREIISRLRGSTALFGEIFEYYLRKKEVTASAVADNLHVAPAAVSNWRRGRRLPDSAMLYGIGSALKLFPEEARGLFIAWSVTCRVKSQLPYVEAAYRNGDYRAVSEIWTLERQWLDI